MDNKIVLIILSIFLPPLAVYLKAGAGKHLIINIILCFVFFFPAILHSLYIVLK
ncbi:YqaE/Pmp3 family membrane protein [Wenyingzhuangia sp. IMCC45533]